MYNINKKMLIYIVFLGLMVILIGNSTIVAETKPDIVKMVGLLQEDEDLDIGDWSVLAREINKEIATKQEFENEVSALKHKYPQFQWHRKDDTSGWKAEASNYNVDSGLTESIKIMTTEAEFDKVTYVIYEVKGQKWKKANPAFFRTTFQNRVNDLFIGTPSIFSCIKGSINDNMDSVLNFKTEDLLDMFQAREIESVHETNFTSISAHSTLFKQPLTNQKLNLQFGLRTEGLGERTNFVVGTPIITFEY
ncbi:YwmB family TATA-box binding protein [Peribacillus muralis]|uniref:YwmB family TATA-box binding protein n=1 Tax=Peribacillus muralis TaxID=264697 RepID=UPI001F4EDC2E|nr:YwmB family TATA-box binding protein [Peribacillus muralis]MCK1994517.1 YwmB family TATA-box binding protein [Peribacillus muralis]MCK2015249.1 YwmB family TATA-box binding protein [Peribacillus muralis]